MHSGAGVSAWALGIRLMGLSRQMACLIASVPEERGTSMDLCQKEPPAQDLIACTGSHLLPPWAGQAAPAGTMMDCLPTPDLMYLCLLLHFLTFSY